MVPGVETRNSKQRQRRMEVAQIRELMWRGCRHRGCCAAHIEQSGEPTAEQLQDIDHSGAKASLS